MQVYGNDVGTFPVDHDGTALGKYLRVKWSGSVVSACGAAEKELGTTVATVLSGETKVNLVPKTAPAVKMVAAEAVTKGAKVYGAASGKVGVTSGGGQVEIGQAQEAASGDGSIFTVLRTADPGVPA